MTGTDAGLTQNRYFIRSALTMVTPDCEFALIADRTQTKHCSNHNEIESFEFALN